MEDEIKIEGKREENSMDYIESSSDKRFLWYDKRKWEEIKTEPINTLQLFITNRCNLRCLGCFYKNRLGKEEMSFQEYQENVRKYSDEVDKVILLGGEPTIHFDLEKMLEFNRSLGLKTTVYTNGASLKRLENADLTDVSVRIGVYGAFKSEKPLINVARTKISVDIVYMLRRDNVYELMNTAGMAESEFNCRGFYISSIRDIERTGSFWKDTSETLPIKEYTNVVRDFVRNYSGNIPLLHLARRGVLYTGNENSDVTCKCRFGNIFLNGDRIICPLDISKNITSGELIFNQRPCNKHTECILQKIVLKRRS